MKNLISGFIGLIILSFQFISAQELTQTIRGTVLDVVTGIPLPGATVFLMNTQPSVGTTTDVQGVFELKDIPIGRQSIEIRFVGYETAYINNLLLTSAKETVIEVKLSESVTELDEVVIKAKGDKQKTINEMAMISARSFTVEETERFAGSLGDPARMVANYAGVVTQNDSRNDIIIRGNSPTGVLWRIEDIEIPNPNHFSAVGTTGGPVSMVNNNLLLNSDFFTGAFPAEYGNATAGVFDLHMRSGNNQAREYTGQIGFNGFELGVEGPVLRREKGVNPSYLANFRYSTLEVMDLLGFNIGTGAAIPQYKDLTFLVDIPATKLGRFKIIGLWGESYIELGRGVEDTTSNSYNPRGVAVNYGSGLAVLGVSHTYNFNSKSRLRTTVSYQETSSEAVVDSVFREVDDGDDTKPFYRGDEKENKFSVSSNFTYKVNSKNNFSIGAIYDNFWIDYIDSVNLPEFGGFRPQLDIVGDMYLFRGYAQWQYKLSDELQTYVGVNSQYSGLNNQSVVEPRAGVKWFFTPKQSLSFGYGRHSQLQAKTVYFYQEYDTVNNQLYPMTNKDLGFTRSDHYVLGYDYIFSQFFRIKLETYYQDLYDVPVKQSFPEFSLINSGDFFGIPLEDSLVNSGTGRNYGVELTIEKFLSKGYYVLFTASVFDSKYKGTDNVLRNTAFNGNYVFNLLTGYEIKLKNNYFLTFDAKVVWAGGRRYVPLDFDEIEQTGEEERNWSLAYENKYDDYFRTDFRIGFRINGKKVSQEWAVDLQNLTGFKSVFMEGYDKNKQETYYTYQQGFFPMVLYRIQF